MPLAMRLVRSSSSSRGPSDPGTVGTPDCCIALIAATLSPIIRMVAAVGPIKVKPLLSTISAKSAFSAKNPYPG